VIDTLLTALLLGFLAGAAPGPYTTVVASTALERGFRPAFRLAFIPLVTETPALLVTVVLLQQLNYEILTVVGVVGGVVLAALGVRLFLRQEDGPGSEEGEEGGDFWHLAAAGLLSPVPWIFWLVAAGPLFLRSWRDGWVQGLVFIVVLYGMFIGTATAIAWGASRGHRFLSDRRRRTVLRGVGIFLMVVGGVLLWQSWEGNFQAMIQDQEELRERVDDAEPL